MRNTEKKDRQKYRIGAVVNTAFKPVRNVATTQKGIGNGGV